MLMKAKKIDKPKRPPVELTREEIELVDYIKFHELTLVSYERLWATLMACKHVLERGIPGDFVECGVWRGGNAMLAAEVFRMHQVTDRKVWVDEVERPLSDVIVEMEGQHHALHQ